MEKIEKKELIAEYDFDALDGISLDDLIMSLQSCKNDQYTKYSINSDLDNENGKPYFIMEVYGFRLETDKELEDRKNQVAKNELTKYLAEIKEKENNGNKNKTSKYRSGFTMLRF